MARGHDVTALVPVCAAATLPPFGGVYNLVEHVPPKPQTGHWDALDGPHPLPPSTSSGHRLSHVVGEGRRARSFVAFPNIPLRQQAHALPTHDFDGAGVPGVRVSYWAPRLPVVQNYFRHEYLWGPLAQAICTVAHAGPPPTAIHAQHVQVAPAAILAGRKLGCPVVVTVRDHWPWHYFATGLHGDQVPLPQHNWAALATDLIARLGAIGGLLALPALPYMLGHMRRRAAYLAQANAVIAVSNYIAGRLAGIVAAERLHVLPNLVDLAANEALAATPPQTTWNGKLLLFVGKLETNKGAGLLPAIFQALRKHTTALPAFTLVIAGNGALRQQLARAMAAQAIPTHFLEWADHTETLRLMARCDLLLFPSQWGEPLSRVLLEAATLGAPILAMPTGGTPDIIEHEVTGIFAPTIESFAARLAQLLSDDATRQRLGNAARQSASQRFAVSRLIHSYEHLYTQLVLPL
ncbi:hypothetical protein CJ255_10655 [Candidatus Viridilinea mediisalina]|uniref:Glycosyl transferase family 1 n=2 Tax=Candidatus Viridilinea mediisalina TaxID=2024553 RepID=A0A2A6RJR9_9CHLR|nr:hypothetical protein CJ255_10655 [Candidatus Viridilinea mediisalina]